MGRPGVGEEPGRLLHALQEGTDPGEAWQQETSRCLGAKGDRHPEERQSAGRVRDQERAADHRQLELRLEASGVSSAKSIKPSAQRSRSRIREADEGRTETEIS